MSEQSPQRITHWSEMEGKTIQSAFENAFGDDGICFDAVLVFSDSTWAAVSACGGEGSYVEAGGFGSIKSIDTVLSADQLLAAGLVNTEQAKVIRERHKSLEAERKAARAANLRAELKQLEEDSAA